MRWTHATSRHTRGKIPHFSFLSSEELCDWELSPYWNTNTPKMYWPSLSSWKSFPFSHIICHRASQAIKENLVEQRMIFSIGFHLPTEHGKMGARIPSAIILDKLKWLELRRRSDLRKIGQDIQIDTFSSTRVLYDANFLSQGLYLTFDLTITKLLVLS